MRKRDEDQRKRWKKIEKKATERVEQEKEKKKKELEAKTKEFQDRSDEKLRKRNEEEEKKKKLKEQSRSRTTEWESKCVVMLPGRHMTQGNVACPLSKDSSLKSPPPTVLSTVTKKKAVPVPVSQPSQQSQPPTTAAQKPSVSMPVPQTVSAKKSAASESVSQVVSPVQIPPKQPPSPKPTPPLPLKPVPIPRPKITVPSTAGPSSSAGGTGVFDNLPAGTLSRSVTADKNWKKLVAKGPSASSSSDLMDTSELPSSYKLTPTGASSHPATVYHTFTQSKDPKAMQMSLKVPSGGGGQGDTFNLDLTRCTPSTIGQVVNVSEVLGDSDLNLVPMEASILLESCANVIQTAGGSKINAMSVLWAVLYDALERCNVPAGDLTLGHYHHPMFHGPSAQEFADIRPPWVHFMDENPNSPLTQKMKRQL